MLQKIYKSLTETKNSFNLFFYKIKLIKNESVQMGLLRNLFPDVDRPIDQRADRPATLLTPTFSFCSHQSLNRRDVRPVEGQDGYTRLVADCWTCKQPVERILRLDN